MNLQSKPVAYSPLAEGLLTLQCDRHRVNGDVCVYQILHVGAGVLKHQLAVPCLGHKAHRVREPRRVLVLVLLPTVDCASVEHLAIHGGHESARRLVRVEGALELVVVAQSV